MKQTIFILFTALLLIVAPGVMAMQGHKSDGNHSDRNSHKAANDHDDTKHNSPGGTFMHENVAKQIKAEFQVMSLKSMNMKDPEGNTHHIMVKLFPEGSDEQIKNAVGKVKIISPSKKETITTLKDYSGIFAANFKADEPGKYGVICMLKVNDKKPVYKFWYPHVN